MDVQPVPSSPPAGPSGPVLLYDGECGLCNRFVRLLLRLDARGALHFAALQAPSAQAYLRSHGLPAEDFDSLVFVPDWPHADRPEFLLRTDGLIAAFQSCGGMLRAALPLLRIIPSSWRDAAYRLIARTRYRIFGAWKPRPLPKPEWASRFFN